jgi:AraC-like DNA-binding protein
MVMNYLDPKSAPTRRKGGGLRKYNQKFHYFTMSQASHPQLKMDFYGVHPRLVWANAREVEPEFLTSGETRGGTDTVVWFIQKGAVTITYENAQAHAEAGQWIFLRAENGLQRFEPGSRLISLRFHLRLRGGESLFAPPRDLIAPEADLPRLMKSALALVAEFARFNAHGMLWAARERFTLVDNFRIEAAFMNWLGAYVEAMERFGEKPASAGERDERVVKALTLIEEHRMRDKFSEPLLARRCNLSVNQLIRVFHREFGMSPFQYYEKQRLELASQALAGSKLPIKEIGFELGFGSPAHFSNWFAERAGMPPRAYRQRRT